MRTSKGVMWVEIDVSDLSKRLSGISASNLMRMPAFKRTALHCGLKAKTVVVQATRTAVPADPREAWRAVSIGYSDRKGAPVLFLGINENRTVERRAWNPKRKGTRGKRSISADTRKRNAYWGRSRAFVLRFLNTGTQVRYTNTRGRWNKARSSYAVKTIDKNVKSAKRGAITKTKGFFYKPAKRALAQAGREWLALTSDLIAKTFNQQV